MSDLKTHYVLVHSGSGSMSECADAIASFGPYTPGRAAEVAAELEHACSGYDEGLHVRTFDTASAGNDPTGFVRERTKSV